MNLYKYDWNKIKIDYESQMSRRDLRNKYKFQSKHLTQAIKEGLLEKRKTKVINSNITRSKISKTIKKYLSENPDKHVWKRSDKFKSKPCEYLKSFLNSKNIKFISEHTVVNNYSIDIAFPEYKLGLEVNGNQHYDENGKLKEYYIKREKAFNSNGWNLIQIHYKCCYNDNFKNELLNKILIYSSGSLM